MKSLVVLFLLLIFVACEGDSTRPVWAPQSYGVTKPIAFYYLSGMDLIPRSYVEDGGGLYVGEVSKKMFGVVPFTYRIYGTDDMQWQRLELILDNVEHEFHYRSKYYLLEAVTTIYRRCVNPDLFLPVFPYVRHNIISERFEYFNKDGGLYQGFLYGFIDLERFVNVRFTQHILYTQTFDVMNGVEITVERAALKADYVWGDPYRIRVVFRNVNR